MFDRTPFPFVAIRKFQCRFRSSLERRARIAALLMILGVAGVLGCAQSASAADDQFYKTVDGIAVYIGVLPAEMIKGHPSGHPEATMHGGLPAGQHEYHLVVAIFDSSSGQRISDASVKAWVSERGVGGNELVLEPMQIEGTVTYGGFVSFPSTAQYVVHLDIARAQAAPVSLDFSYDHQPP